MRATYSSAPVERETPTRLTIPPVGPDTPSPPPASRLRGTNVGTLALVVLTLIAVVAALQLGRGLFVPLIIGVLISYILEPVVAAVVNVGLPRALAATIVFVVSLMLVGSTAFAL